METQGQNNMWSGGRCLKILNINEHHSDHSLLWTNNLPPTTQELQKPGKRRKGVSQSYFRSKIEGIKIYVQLVSRKCC